MKYKIVLKDPGGVSDAIRGFATESASKTQGLDSNEFDALIDSRKESIAEELSRWIDCGEYVTIEIDTDARTAIVLEAK